MFLSRTLALATGTATAVTLLAAPPSAAAGGEPIAGFTDANSRWQRASSEIPSADFTDQQRRELGVVNVSRDIRQARAWEQAARALRARADGALRDGDTEAFGHLNEDDPAKAREYEARLFQSLRGAPR